MIPTKYKAKLPKFLSWPIGAEAISGALGDAPHVAELTLAFADRPVLGSSEFQQILRDSRPYRLLVAEYSPATKPGHGTAQVLIDRGLCATTWGLTVYPVLREKRATAAAALRETGLHVIVDWLRGSSRGGWTNRFHRLALVFDPVEGRVAPEHSEGV